MSSREHTGISRGWALANQFSSKSFNHIFHFIFPKAVRTHFKQVDMWDYLRIIKRRLAPDYCGIRVKSLPFLDKSWEIQPCLFFFCCLSLSCWRHGNVPRLQTHLKLSNLEIPSSGIYIPPTFLLICSIKGVIQPTAPVSELYGRYMLLPLTCAHVLWTEWVCFFFYFKMSPALILALVVRWLQPVLIRVTHMNHLKPHPLTPYVDSKRMTSHPLGNREEFLCAR